MTEIIYEYDGSFEGFLSCVFESYLCRELPAAFSSGEELQSTLFPVRMVLTDLDRAARVYRKTVKLSPEAADLLRRGFLTCLPEREMHLFRLERKLLDEGPRFLRDLSDETLLPVLRAVRHLNGEVHQYKGFTRFSDLGGVLGGEIRPRNHVLPLLRRHFCDRYRNERFFLYDRTHHEALFYQEGKSLICPLDHFQMAPADETEAQYRLLWKRFYDTIAIRERENPRCRMTQMPKRYWSTMTEFQDDSHFRPTAAPAAVSGPGAPAGIPAPGTLPGSGPTAPGSTP